MATQTNGRMVTVESAAALIVNRVVAKASSGLWAHSTADTRIDGVVAAIGGETAAPYTASVQIDGIAQVQSDGAGSIAAGDFLAAGGTAGQVKTRAPADGATVRYYGGVAMSPAAATQALLVDMLIRPQWGSGA
jgi:hypothetical protein